MFLLDTDNALFINRFCDEIKKSVKRGEPLVIPTCVKILQLNDKGEWVSING